MMKWKRIEITILSLMAILFGYAAWVSIAQQTLSNDLLRLHVIANSDSVQDQQVKLMVRDRVLEVTKPLLEGAQTQAQVRTRLGEHLQQITDEANNVLQEQGMPYTLTAQVANEYYPTRFYDTFSLPAGDYTGLKIRLGQAQGKNWWCVVFPPLCIEASQAPQGKLCQNDTFRFKTAEVIGQIKEWFASFGGH